MIDPKPIGSVRRREPAGKEPGVLLQMCSLSAESASLPATSWMRELRADARGPRHMPPAQPVLFWPILAAAVATPPRLGVPCSARSRLPASRTAPRAFLLECGGSLPERTRLPVSRRSFPAGGRVAHVRSFCVL